MQTTRRRIIAYLEANHSATAHEMSSLLRQTVANVRYHLAILESEGLVEVVGQKPSANRGRPSLLYMSTHRAQPHNLAGLAAALFKELIGTRESKQRDQRLRRLAAFLAGEVRPQAATSQRLLSAVQRLNTLNYSAHWEAHADGPRVILGQCPYAAIIEDYPQLCQMDAQLIEILLGESVEQTAKLQRSPEGPPHCVFLLQSKT